MDLAAAGAAEQTSQSGRRTISDAPPRHKVRDHTTGKTQHEIATLNIDLAWENLKLKYEAFDFRNEPVPQLDAIRTFAKKQLAAGHVVVMMIQKVGNHFPIARRFTLQEGSFSHIVPFVGLMSDNPLTDETWYDDDYIVHYHDHDVNDVNYRSMKSLVGSYDNTTGSGCPSQPDTSDSGYICLNPSFGYGWALTGFNDTKAGLPLSLTVDPSDKEPDRSGCDGRGTTCEDPIPLTGTLHINGLAAGQKYAIYRWDSVESAFDYTRPASVHRFTASGPSLNYTDTTTIISNGTTYYRCVDDS